MFLAGGVFLVVLAPLFVTGFGEAAMALPLAGACIAALAGYLLRLKR
jgi:LPXTG-motif cell wall-anchored protein